MQKQSYSFAFRKVVQRHYSGELGDSVIFLCQISSGYCKPKIIETDFFRVIRFWESVSTNCVAVIQMATGCQCGRSTHQLNHATWSSEEPTHPVLLFSIHSATTTVICGETLTVNYRTQPLPKTLSLPRCCSIWHNQYSSGVSPGRVFLFPLLNPAASIAHDIGAFCAPSPLWVC